MMGAVLQVGDWAHVDGQDHQVVALTGSTLRLRSASGTTSVVLTSYLLAAEDFALIEGTTAPRIEPLGLLEGLPEDVVAKARDWERHLIEVITGWPDGAGSAARAGYEPDRRTVQGREEVKAAELTAAGRAVSTRTVRRLQLRYTEQGLLGLIDQRALRASTSLGRAHERLIAAIRTELDAQTHASTGTRGRLMRRVVTALEAEHGPGVVPVPSRTTFYELVAALSSGQHSFETATTRRSLANRPAAVFTLSFALRPAGTKAVDAALLLARMLVPELARGAYSPRTADRT